MKNYYQYNSLTNLEYLCILDSLEHFQNLHLSYYIHRNSIFTLPYIKKRKINERAEIVNKDLWFRRSIRGSNNEKKNIFPFLVFFFFFFFIYGCQIDTPHNNIDLHTSLKHVHVHACRKHHSRWEDWPDSSVPLEHLLNSWIRRVLILQPCQRLWIPKCRPAKLHRARNRNFNLIAWNRSLYKNPSKY